MGHDDIDVDLAMERLRSRSWRVPSADRIMKENAMKQNTGIVATFVRTHRLAAAALALLIGASAVAGVAAAVQSYRGTLVDEFGNAYDVELTPLGDGTYGASTDGGGTIIFQPAEGGGGEVVVELGEGDAPSASVEIDPAEEGR